MEIVYNSLIKQGNSNNVCVSTFKIDRDSSYSKDRWRVSILKIDRDSFYSKDR